MTMTNPESSRLQLPQTSALAARTLASEIIAHAADDGPFDATAILKKFPQLRHHRSIVLDLAHEEYCRRTEAGEELRASDFAARFSGHQESVLKVVQFYNLFKDDEEFIRSSAVPWPGIQDDFLGFRLREELGRGAFSRVFAAEEPALGHRDVIVKVCTNGNFEAQTLGQLRHPHIVPVFSVQHDQKLRLTAICMPYLGRSTLFHILEFVKRQKRWPGEAAIIREALIHFHEADLQRSDGQADVTEDRWNGSFVDAVAGIALQLTQALGYTHQMGIYHSDIKPSNILVTCAGDAMLFDFNLAFDTQAVGNNIGGTLPYMAPEQLTVVQDGQSEASGQINACTDIFSFGVTFYEMLTGQLPFGDIPEKASQRDVVCELLERQQAGPIPLSKLRRAGYRELANLIEACLSFEPSHRPQSASILAESLRREFHWLPRSRRWLRQRRLGVLAGVGATVILAVTGGNYLLTREPADVREYRMGRAAFRRGDYLLAEARFTRLLSQHPNAVELHFARGRARMLAGNANGALLDFNEISRLKGPRTDPRVIACQGYCIAQKAPIYGFYAGYEEALSAFTQSVSLQGHTSAGIENNLGYCKLKTQKYAAAETHLRKAIELDPQLSAAYFNLAVVDLEISQRTTDRLPDLDIIRTAIRLGPASGELCLHAACILALAAERTPADNPEIIRGLVEETLAFIEQGRFVGLNQVHTRKIAALHPPIATHARFQAVAENDETVAVFTRAERLVDPLPDIGTGLSPMLSSILDETDQ